MSIEIKIRGQPLEVAAIYSNCVADGGGAVNLFVGTVRDQTKGKQVVRLEYEAYESMAIKEMEKLAFQAVERWSALKVIVHHRVGTLHIGEPAVVIAVSTPHRQASFEACKFIIDTLKETVPIWKKEVFEDGEVWVSATP